MTSTTDQVAGFVDPSVTTLLRFATAGSVDDGKSTLVGRLLHDSKSVLTDQLEAVEAVSAQRGQDAPDLALLTDGLRAEREQGITIDVAYRYFATARRRFILADTPGHVQYTRNMVTGASTADLAVVLVDARNGVIEQTCSTRGGRRPAAGAARGPGRQQDGPGGLRGEGLRGDRRGVHRVRLGPGRPGDHRDPDLGAGRGQRGGAVRAHGLVRRPDRAGAPGDRPGQPRPDGLPGALPGAVRDPPADRRAPRLPRLRGPDRLRRAARRRGRDRTALGPYLGDRGDRRARRGRRHRLGPAVGDAAPGGRHRHLAR